MTIPAIVLGIVTSTALGALFHVWRGGSPGKLLLYLVLSWTGFWAGHFIGKFIGLEAGKFGPVYFLFACVGSLILLGIGYWLSLVEVEKK